jgi:streptogramin lyase
VLDDGSESVLRIEPDGTVHEEVTEADVIAETTEADVGYADRGIAVAEDGTVYFTDSVSNSLLRHNTDGSVEVVADEAAIATAAGVDSATANPRHVSVGHDGTVYVVDGAEPAVVAVDPADGSVTLVADTFPNGFSSSGGLVPDGSGGLWVASDADSLDFIDSAGTVTELQTMHNEIQEVSNDATGGTFTLTFDAEETGPIAFDASAAAVQAALEALASVGAGNVEVRGTGDADAPWVVEFVETLGLADQSELVADDTLLTGGTTTVTTAADGGTFNDLDTFMTRSPNPLLYLADDGVDIVYRVDPDDGSIRSFLTRTEIAAVTGEGDIDPEGGIAFDGDGNFYMAEATSDDIVRFDSDRVGEVWVSAADVEAVTTVAPNYLGGIAFASTFEDNTPPTVTCDEPAPVFEQGGDGGEVTATVTDEASGPAEESVSSPADVSSSGDKTVAVTGADNAGNETTVECPYSVTQDAGETGYRMVAGDGGIFTFGDRNFHGSTGALVLNQPIVGGATRGSDLDGYWIVAADGGVFAFNAEFHGSLANEVLPAPAVEIEPTPTGKGYWIVLANGTVRTFGDAAHFGDMTGQVLNRPIIGMSVTTTGLGYWLVAQDGGIFSFGDAVFHGSMGGQQLNSPVIDLGPTTDGGGYYLLGGDGGVFSFGSAVFHGSTGAIQLNQPVVAMLVRPNGYWLGAADGGVFTFGGLPFLGSMGAVQLNAPVLDMID